MAFSETDVKTNREYFASKLLAEKQKADVVKRVEERVGDFLLLDTRSRQAFAKGHIQGAWCFPLEEIDALVPHLPKDRELVTYCWNHT